MMRFYLFLAALLLLCFLPSCGRGHQHAVTVNRLDSLQNELAHTYRPGLGEFMSTIQVHHDKLWFAGHYGNWKLAEFEVHEIMESLSDINTYASERKETKLIGMLDPALDSVNSAILKQDTALFHSSYLLLTGTCNSCHQATDHCFNVITVPSSPPFSDQEFRPRH